MLGGAGTLGVLAVVFWWMLPERPAGKSTGDSSPTILRGANGTALQGRTESPLIKLPAPDVAKPAVLTADAPATPASPPPTTRPSDVPVVAPPPTAAPGDARADLVAGLKALEARDLLAARDRLNAALKKGLPASEATEARQKLRELADKMIFSPARTPGDPLVGAYVVKTGDTLKKVAQAHRISEDLLADINRISDKHFIRLNQTLKVIHGPFHAVVDKSDHELQVHLDGVYVAGFRVALGMNGSTPTGKWIVRDQLQNPSWVDPRTGKRWRADDPENPIGEYWIGLEGVEGDAVGQIGFGIHGTIDEASIGQDVSMGCVRLAAKDIEFVYKLLMPKLSTVVIQD